MACGCGGKCCGQPKGLGFLYLESAGGYGDSWGEDWWGGGDTGWGGWDSGGWWDTSGGGGGLDFWGLDDASYWDYFGWNVGPSYSPGTSPGFNVDFGFLPSNTTTGAGNYGTPNDNWQGLLDWWRDLTTPRPIPPISPDPNTSTLPPFSGYCPPNTYCADFPTCSSCLPLDNSRAARAAAAAHKAAQAAAKAQQQRQQQQQGCPPNTGLVKNAQGQCVCPPGYAPNAQLKKCVLVNPALAAQANQAPDWLKYLLLALGGVVVVKQLGKK